MSRGPQRFQKAEVQRALRATKAAGLNVAGLKIGRNGEIEIVIGKTTEAAAQDTPESLRDLI